MNCLFLGYQKEVEFNAVISGFKLPFYHTPELLREYYRVLKPKGVLLFDELFKETSNEDPELKFYPHFASRLKLNGFTVDRPESSGTTAVTRVVARKPNYEVCGFLKLFKNTLPLESLGNCTHSKILIS